MAAHRRSRRLKTPGTRVRAEESLAYPARVAIFDAMHTLKLSKKGGRKYLYELHRKAAQLPANFRQSLIDEAILVVEARYAHVVKDWTPGEYRLVTNSEVLKILNPRFFEANPAEAHIRGREIHVRYQSNVEAWHTPEVIRQMLQLLAHAGIPLYVGSNQEPEYLKAHIEDPDCGLARFFPEERRFASGDLRVYKPNHEFVRRICERIDVDPSEVVYVGNSPRHDVPMLEAGCQVIMMDIDDRYHELVAGKKFRTQYGRALSERRLLIRRSPMEVGRILLRACARH